MAHDISIEPEYRTAYDEQAAALVEDINTRRCLIRVNAPIVDAQPMRLLFWASAAVLGVVAGVGLIRNNGNKFVRTLTQQGCIANYANAVESKQPRLVCCSRDDGDDYGVCKAGRSKSTKVLTSSWAFVIPILGLLVNATCDKLSGGVTPARTRARWNRFWLYIAVILMRTGFLYLGLNYLEGRFQGEESRSCWYAHLRRSGKCSERFDFADHMVLAVCQYYAIQVFEMYCIVKEYLDQSSAPCRKDWKSRPSMCSLCIVPPVAVCAIVAGFSLLLVYNTTAFFHTRGETLVALILSWFAVGSHLLSLMSGGGGGNGLGGEEDHGGSSVLSPSLSSPSRGVFLAPLG